MSNSTPLIDLASRIKDNSSRVAKNRENMRETHAGMTRVVERYQWIANMENYFAAKSKPWDEQTKADYRTFLANRKDDEVLGKLKELVNNFSFQYRGIIGASNELARIAQDAMNLAQPEFQELAKRNVNITGLDPDGAKPSPEQAAQNELDADMREHPSNAPAAPNLAGPSI